MDALGIYIRDAEGAKDWGRVLEDFRRRGVEDVLISCVDGLSGFSEAILEVFPQSFVQRCIIHMIRSSTRFVSDKHLKHVCADLRSVYTAVDQIQAQLSMEAFHQKWDGKYPEIAQSWEQNWDELMLFMDYEKNI